MAIAALPASDVFAPDLFADVHRFMCFAAEFADLTDAPADLPPRSGC
jgi:hypothetical protein